MYEKYEELVERLRDAAKISEAISVIVPIGDENPTAELFNEAADAIKTLCDEVVEGYEE